MLVWDHWHIEPSSICTLRCPRCPRAEVPESLLNRQLTLKFFQEQLGPDVIKQIRKITFHRFESTLSNLTNKTRPGQLLKEIFFSRAQDLQHKKQYSGICLIGNKGVFLNSQGEFYPCCWTANRYQHNDNWHTLAQHRFNLIKRPFQDIIKDEFWSTDFLKFDSLECCTKCTPEKLSDKDHTTEW